MKFSNLFTYDHCELCADTITFNGVEMLCDIMDVPKGAEFARAELNMSEFCIKLYYIDGRETTVLFDTTPTAVVSGYKPPTTMGVNDES